MRCRDHPDHRSSGRTQNAAQVPLGMRSPLTSLGCKWSLCCLVEARRALSVTNQYPLLVISFCNWAQLSFIPHPNDRDSTVQRRIPPTTAASSAARSTVSATAAVPTSGSRSRASFRRYGNSARAILRAGCGTPSGLSWWTPSQHQS